MRLLALLSALLAGFVGYSLAVDDGDPALLTSSFAAAALSLLAALCPRRREPARGYSSTLTPTYHPAVAPMPTVDALSPKHSPAGSSTLSAEQRLLVVHKLQQRKKTEAVRDVRSWTGVSAKEARVIVDRIERVV